MDSQRFTRAVLVASALAFAGPGAGFLLAPDRFAAAVDLEMLSATSASDVRAVMGGLEVGIAGVLAVAARSGPLRAALVLQLGALAGLLLGRAVSLVAEGAPGPLAWLLAGVEALLFVAGAVALRRLREPNA